MAISLASLKKTTPNPHPFTLIYGVEKVGKSALAASWPSPVFVQTPGENPPAEVSVDTFGEVADYGALMEALDALAIEDHSFETLVIDAADGLERIVNAEACRLNGWQSIEDPGYGKGYVAADDLWAGLISILNDLRAVKSLNIVLIAHAETFRFDSPTSDPYTRYRPNLRKSKADLLQANADIIAFVNHRVSIVKEDVGFKKEIKRGEGAGLRVIYLDERPGFIAGNRYSMPAEIAFKKGSGFAEIAKHLPQAAA